MRMAVAGKSQCLAIIESKYACKSLQNCGSAVPAIVADRIIDVAKNGERDPARLYEQALKAFGIGDTSMLFVSVGDHPLPASLRSRPPRDQESPVSSPGPGLSFSLFGRRY
jgi:hypothetical protein